MTPENFCYWLQGFFELALDSNDGLTDQQTQQVKNHLSMVFKHSIDPSLGDESHQEDLRKAHDRGRVEISEEEGVTYRPPRGSGRIMC